MNALKKSEIKINIDNFLVKVYHQGIVVGHVKVILDEQRVNSADFSVHLLANLNIEERHFVYIALLKISLVFFSQKKKIEFFRVSSVPEAYEKDLISLGFKKLHGNQFQKNIPVKMSQRIERLKLQIKAHINQMPLEGRGYVCVALENYNVTDLNLLGEEYSDIAWGLEGWAKNNTMSTDEEDIINKYIKPSATGLEIGAGSGRITEAVKSLFNKLDVTDIHQYLVDQLNIKFAGSNVQATVDDIANTYLDRNAYDVVMFWENGLGAILDSGYRRKALENMVSLCKPGGTIIIGFRELNNSPCAHIMYASQTAHVVGIYHTFSQCEIKHAIEGLPAEFTVINGDSRPAGGQQLFLIGRKNESM